MNPRLLLPCLAALSFAPIVSPAHAAEPKPALALVSETYLPDIVGDFDHFTVDLRRNHLFVSAEEHHSVEMFDLRSGAHLKSLGGFQTPHSLAFSPEKDELMVCDGGASELVLVSGESLQPTAHVALISGAATGSGDSPDAGYYDSTSRLYYIGNGGASAKMETSKISIFSVDQGKLIGSLDVPGNNVESMGVDNLHHRLYVNIRDKKEIGVYDLSTRKLLTTWTAPGMNRNTALLVDAKDGRVFVAGRTPGMLYVFNLEGKLVAQQPCAEKNDDMSFDPATKLLYVSGSQGLSIFHQDSPDKYTELTRPPTNGGKTSALVPQAKRLFVVHPRTDVDMAALLVYKLTR